MNGDDVVALPTLLPVGDEAAPPVYTNVVRAAEIVGVPLDRKFLHFYEGIIKEYLELLIVDHLQPDRNRAISIALSKASEDPFGTLKLHLAGKLELNVAQSVQAAIAESIDLNNQLGEELDQIPHGVLSFMLNMQNAIEHESRRYRGPRNKRGPKKSLSIWVITHDVFHFFDNLGAKISLPSNANADDNNSLTPILRFTEILLADATAAAQSALTNRRDIDINVRAILQDAIRRDASIPRRTLMLRLREYGHLRRGRNFEALQVEIPASH